ncbi:hypothetical protein SAMN06265365_1662 [Tistlia consotensis]|uniref:Uncharacterized protein n=1 Tax=Tistlia consotensis USBA 355 TaxID=560819 RepID=A0A1Y6CRZ3_9PROT|nr:nitrate/nitrite transporter NrtS [Tistlia consotensis]SMF84022.1 hypothetical protein SAMN05428998_15220 [Tistlia consotensis USBA 355]SNS40001.1 hypothetical protein SAMN06265365_1662 [Tistlia consotensis]
MSKTPLVLRMCLSDGVPKRSAIVALVVGTILNLINQGDALLAGGDIDLVKVALTFLVPYGVATYGAVAYRLSAAVAEQRPAERATAGSRVADAA